MTTEIFKIIKTVAEVMGVMGWRISEAAAMPEWLPSSRFAKLERGNTKAVPEEVKNER
jgi:hypothetical protein